MQYFGGKQRIAVRVAEYINSHIPKVYLEPFCGSCHVGLHVKAQRRIFCDLNPWLIAMWQAAVDGWIPPVEVSEDLYQQAKSLAVEPALIGFVGFACSFSGKFFGGYARNSRGDNYALNGSRSVRNYALKLRGSEFLCCSYQEALMYNPEVDLVYCDPPYQGTTRYYGLPNMDYNEFWESMRLSGTERTTLVSEYNAPEDFRTTLTIKTKTEIRTSSNGREDRVEKLFTWP